MGDFGDLGSGGDFGEQESSGGTAGKRDGMKPFAKDLTIEIDDMLDSGGTGLVVFSQSVLSLLSSVAVLDCIESEEWFCWEARNAVNRRYDYPL